MEPILQLEFDSTAFPDSYGELTTPVKQLVWILEDLLVLQYPDKPSHFRMNDMIDPFLKEITYLVIGYYYMTQGHKIGTDTNVFKWLRIKPSDIPPQDVIYRKMRDPSIVDAICSYGILNYKQPEFALLTPNPAPDNVLLDKTVNHCHIGSFEKVIYRVTAEDVVQTQIVINTECDVFHGSFHYNMAWHLGKQGALLNTVRAAKPYNRPINLRSLVYNARGARLDGFRNHVKLIVEQFSPMFVIVTESRQGVEAARDFASFIGYP
ncbi:hypothetical protein COLO4_28122 [Corchorus olitorius]|uniref:Uncharacterized protein n=1 Tax=Corchorus olitorius TaxID=93759 RepID=A0A1R3HN00_9ROSI|nr:hypothetical protein COLO4_28122 [Corchorus olitorius]